MPAGSCFGIRCCKPNCELTHEITCYSGHSETAHEKLKIHFCSSQEDAYREDHAAGSCL